MTFRYLLNQEVAQTWASLHIGAVFAELSLLAYKKYESVGKAQVKN